MSGGVGDGEAVAVGVSVGGEVGVAVGGIGVTVAEGVSEAGIVAVGVAARRGLQAESARTSNGIRKKLR